MAIALNDTRPGFRNRVESRVQLHEPIDGVIEPVNPADNALQPCSRRLRPNMLAELQRLQRNGVPQHHVKRGGPAGVMEMTPAEKAAADALPP